jgi:O-antigen/teichoic acid export membrane protein
LILFLGTTLNLSWIKYFVGSSFREGLPVVPILLLANLFLGVYFNLSIWYKLTGRTRFGMWLTLVGAVLTLVLNFIWIPSTGYFASYMGSAWATLICYAVMMVLSYIIGQRHYPIHYDLKKVLGYLGLALLLYFASTFVHTNSIALDLVINNGLLCIFLAVIVVVEKQQRLFLKSSKQQAIPPNELPS